VRLPLRAVYYHGYRQITTGPATAVAPTAGQVRLEVAYCGLCGTDLHIYRGGMDRRVRLPHVPGHEASAVVAEVGAHVHGLACGDHVVVRPLESCGACPACAAGHSHVCHKLRFLGIDTPGALQSSWTVPAAAVHRIPPELPLDRAALIEPLAVAVHAAGRGEATAGQRAVIIGSGPIGLLAALVLRGDGAEAMLSDPNAARRKLATDLGFQAVDPTAEQLALRVEAWTDGAGADLVIEASGSARGAADMTALARARGRVVLVSIYVSPAQVDLHRLFWREVEIRGARVYERADFDRAISLAAGSNLPLEQLISRRVPLEQTARQFELLAGDAGMMKVLVAPALEGPEEGACDPGRSRVRAA
jgi:(R,R)-butanediol dehydrogenase / meso-butanediol dehydrogenase / diacetyl reductase